MLLCFLFQVSVRGYGLAHSVTQEHLGLDALDS